MGDKDPSVLANLPWYGWLVIFGIAVLLFIVAIVRGFKIGIGDKTIEVSDADGETQQTDKSGLMYILNDNCRQVEQRKKERVDAIIPALSYRLSDISTMSCVTLRAENILNDRRRRNGFENLKSVRLFEDYVSDVFDELYSKTKQESERVITCSAQAAPEVDRDVITMVSRQFAIKAVQACIEEYREKAEMYRRFSPQFAILGDKSRVLFCQQKIKKHEDRANVLSEVLELVTA
jgi:hypothetical protein